MRAESNNKTVQTQQTVLKVGYSIIRLQYQPPTQCNNLSFLRITVSPCSSKTGRWGAGPAHLLHLHSLHFLNLETLRK
jgi:hypothetical protein